MAICNLFRKLSKETGNFLMFSQYSNDLTREFVQHEAYRVVPSKFIAFDINYSNFLKSDFKNELNSSDLNVLIPNYLQNYFENGVSYLSHLSGFTFEPSITTNVFWNALFKAKLLNVSYYDSKWGSKTDGEINNKDSYQIISEMKYVGDIDIHSYEKTDGIGFGETYCYIPNDAKETLYEIRFSGENELCKTYKGDCIEGYEDYSDGATLPGMLQVTTPYDIDYYYNPKWIFNGSGGNTDDLKERFTYDYKSHYTSVKDTVEKSFNFNTIVVLYDIKTQNSDGSWNTAYKDIPMGMYITGLINDDGIVSNTVTKYDEVQDAYTSGTSYGLRVCTRFMVTPNATQIISNSAEATDVKSQYNGFSLAMNKMAESQAKMDKLLTQVIGDSQDIKDHLAQFKNNRANIPYLRKIGTKYYWFVNGRNTGVTNTGEEDNTSGEDSSGSEKTKLTIENGLFIVTDTETGNQYIIDGIRKRVTPLKPIFSKGEGTYNMILPLTISCNTDDVIIYYTTDKSDPKISSTRITGTELTLTQHVSQEISTYVIRAVAYKDGLYSNEVQYTYYIKRQVSTPIITISGTDYDNERVITIYSSTLGSTIHYSTDGGTNYIEKSNPAKITIDNTLQVGNLKVYATLTGWVNSEIYTYPYNINTGALIMYYGLVDTAPTSDAEVETLEKIQSSELPQTITFDSNAGIYNVCFAYPKTLGELTSIKDNNGFEYIDQFTLDESLSKYYVYTTKDIADRGNTTFIFSK